MLKESIKSIKTKKKKNNYEEVHLLPEEIEATEKQLFRYAQEAEFMEEEKITYMWKNKNFPNAEEEQNSLKLKERKKSLDVEEEKIP